jgi:hypothetical protein
LGSASVAGFRGFLQKRLDAIKGEQFDLET